MPLETHENSAVLFADMSGSTKLYLVVGDDRAREIVAKTLDRWSQLTVADGGQVIQLRGDGMLCMFPSVDAALRAAVAMRDMPYEPTLSMHAGIHAGAVQRDAEQLYGDCVNTAARMADIAKKFEIVLTAAARAQLADPIRWRNLRLIPKVPVKGKPEPMDIYLLPNEKQKLTDYRPPLYAKARAVSLQLRYHTTLIIVDASAAACLIGRDDECRMKVDHRLVSRRHASIECVSGKFFLQDHSTNGTYVTEAGGEATLVQREILQLKGTGAISLGIEPAANPDHCIVFSLGS
jgi:class 3 adenylate cyclase